MKRLLCFLLALSCLLCLWGCTEDNDEATANFYYVRDSYLYGQEDGVIAAEARNVTEFTNKQDILRAYLTGPEEPSLVSPFPTGTEIVEFLYKGETLYVTLSTHMVTLSKAKQVLACACFARTAMELTRVKAVYFQTDDTDFARMEPIFIERDSILLYDDYNAPAPTEP